MLLWAKSASPQSGAPTCSAMQLLCSSKPEHTVTQHSALVAVEANAPHSLCHITPAHPRPGPCYMPKPHHLYAPLESSYSPKRPNLVSAADGGYSRAVRQATAPCFSFSNLKQVRQLGVMQERCYSQRCGQCTHRSLRLCIVMFACNAQIIAASRLK